MPRTSVSHLVTPFEIHELAKAKGWWNRKRAVPELLCLIHSEISEALEAYRNKMEEGAKGCLSEELADAVIRIFDMAEALDIDIVGAVNKKHAVNKNRPFRHGGKRC